MNKTILLLLLVSLLSCVGQKDRKHILVDHYKTNKFDVAIFPSKQFKFKLEKRFTPTRREIDKAEFALQTKLEEINKELIFQTSTPVIHQNLIKYKRQYYGFVDNKGQRILYINCFWTGIDKDIEELWLKTIIQVCDGGSYFWNVKYNLENNELFDLEVNGYA